VRPGSESSTHYFSSSGGTGNAELLFLHPVGSAGHTVYSGASGERIVDTLFFKLRWDRYGFDKKRFRTCYAELVFLHPVGCASHVVHSGASEVRNVGTIFFMLGRDWYGFHKNCAGASYVEL
jgi:hypothetical protein